jgi:hypothetical protein
MFCIETYYILNRLEYFLVHINKNKYNRIGRKIKITGTKSSTFIGRWSWLAVQSEMTPGMSSY